MNRGRVCVHVRVNVCVWERERERENWSDDLRSKFCRLFPNPTLIVMMISESIIRIDLAAKEKKFRYNQEFFLIQRKAWNEI